jgi:hypothetical protein
MQLWNLCDVIKLSKFTVNLIVFAVFCFPASSLAKDVTVGDLIRTYRLAAFPNPNNLLVRFQNKPEFILNQHCISGECDDFFGGIARQLIGANIVSKIENESLIAGDILVLQFNDKNADAEAIKGKGAIVVGGDEALDFDGIPECRSVSLRSGTEVRKIVIYVDGGLSDKAKISCTFLQLAKSSGLAINASFSQLKLFSNDNAVDADIRWRKIVQGLARLIKVHFSTNFSPGLTEDEFSKIAVTINDWHSLGVE